jgi:hypothetical protein
MNEERGVEEVEHYLAQVASYPRLDDLAAEVVEGAEALLRRVQRGGGVVSAIRRGRTRYGDSFVAVIFGGGGDPAYAFAEVAERLSTDLIGHRLLVAFVDEQARGRSYRTIGAVLEPRGGASR